MLRAVLLGLLVVSGSACSKSSTETSAKVTPGAAAGKVLEAKGSVTVKHGDAARPLAVGEMVLADDVVITGADGNVVIELAHNSARWELGPNKQTKVSESIAWKAKKATAQEVDEATAAAGRPAERSAAGTVATAAESDEEAPPGKADMAEATAMAPAAPAPEPDMSPKGGGSAPARPTRRIAKAAPPPAPPADIADDEAPAPRRTRGGIRKTESAAAQDSLSGVGAGGGGIAPGAAGGGTRGGGSVDGGGSVGASATTDSAGPSPGSLLAAKSTALHRCMVDHGAKDNVTLTVAVASGKATVKLASKATISAALDKCLKGVVSGIHFSGSANLTQTVTP